MIPVQFIQRKQDLSIDRESIKLWLNDKEVATISAHKEENPTDRSAAEKIVAKYKVHDDTWNQKEEKLKILDRKLSSMTYILDVMKEMVGNYPEETIQLWVDNYATFFMEDY